MKASQAAQCVEIMGGNETRTESFLTSGLEILLVSRPTGGGRGGDVYCIHSCGHGALAKFVLLDLAGHGPERDTFARSVHTLLHRYGNETRPGPLLQQLNRHYRGFVLPPVHATAVSAAYEPMQNEFRMSNAGQPRPFHWSAAESKWSVLQSAVESDCGLPLGIMLDGCYAEETFPLAEGDLLLLASDGLPEIRNPQDEFLDPEGALRELEHSTAAVGQRAPLVHLAETFFRRLLEYRGRPELDDDLTLLWLRSLPRSAGGEYHNQVLS